VVAREVESSFGRAFNLSIDAQTQAQKDPSKAMRENQQAANEAKSAEKLKTNAVKSLTKELKSMGCIDKNGEDSKKSIESDDLGNSCAEVKQDLSDVANADTILQREAMQKMQAAQQQAAQAQQQALAQQRQQMGLGQQQQGILPANTTFGPSSLTTPGTLNYGGSGMVGGIPAYTGGYMNTSPTTMMTGMPMSMGYNPYSYTGIAGMGMNMPSNL